MFHFSTVKSLEWIDGERQKNPTSLLRKLWCFRNWSCRKNPNNSDLELKGVTLSWDFLSDIKGSKFTLVFPFPGVWILEALGIGVWSCGGARDCQNECGSCIKMYEKCRRHDAVLMGAVAGYKMKMRRVAN